MAGRYAHETIHLGADGIVRPGELVPEQFTNSLGEEEATDFDRLEELGVVGSRPPAQPEPEPGDEAVGLEALTLRELRARAAERGVDVPAKARKAELLELLADGE